MRIGWSVAAAALVVTGFAWRGADASAQSAASQRRLKTEAQIQAENLPLPPDALARRERSIRRLRAESVPVLDSLPVIEGESEARRRPAEEIALRTMALLVVAARAEGLGQDRTNELVTRYGLAETLTPEERAFLAAAAMTDADRAKFSWRYEAAWVLLWALGYVDSLARPADTMEPGAAVRILAERGRDRFVREARLRPLPQILDEADLIYRYHWAAVDARLAGHEAPAGLNADVIMERHYALNWLIGYLDQAWDEVTTDT